MRDGLPLHLMQGSIAKVGPEIPVNLESCCFNQLSGWK